jgi:hypothetical protein
MRQAIVNVGDIEGHGFGEFKSAVDWLPLSHL